MLSLWHNICTTLRRGRASDDWHSLLADPKSAALLYQTDDNAAEHQQEMRSLAACNVSFATSIMFFMGRICTTENHRHLLSYTRTTIEVFILYSITTSNFDWILDPRAARLSRHIENLSTSIFQRSQLPPAVGLPTQIKHCLRASAQIKALSRLEHHRAQIIDTLADLAEAMPSDTAFTLYNQNLPYHRQNATAFVKRLKTTGYYWIAMAYCLAIEPVKQDQGIPIDGVGKDLSLF